MQQPNRGRFAFFPVKLNFIVFILAITTWQLNAQGGCSCTNCPQAMPDNFVGNFYLQAQNASNPILGQNGQGVCAVTLHFEHEYLGDLSISLTSPAGQTVTLINPVGIFGETDGTIWDITFVPCGAPANPDPGFSETWSNAQNWGLFGYYTGSYYPFSGCLENFNTGPVNGQWTLTVADGQNNDLGNFFNYSIIFCDPEGIECTSCEANAGNLVQADIAACVGDTSLLLDLPPSYAAPQTPPPSTTYSYTYVIAEGGIIINYDSIPDLRNLPEGSYTVCGLSYLQADSSDIPAPNGQLSIAQLSAQLNSGAPPFCGKITPNCINVDILPPLPDVLDTVVICAPNCYVYYSQQFCASGTYAKQVHENGCTFTATLHLTVLPNDTTHLLETICAGACSTTPGFEGFCDSGIYTQKYQAVNGCDSLVIFQLQVNQVNSVIAAPPPLSCTQSEITLESISSGAGLNYAWTASNGGQLTGPIDQQTAVATSSGSYQLVVCSSNCCDTAQVDVISNQNPPAAPAIPEGPLLICPGQTGWWHTDSLPGLSYQWSLPANVEFSGNQNSAAVLLKWNADSSGTICVQAENACGLSDSACVQVNLQDTLPPPDSIIGMVEGCLGDTLLYVALANSGNSSFLWEFPPDAEVIGTLLQDTVLVLWKTAGTAEICVRTINTCDTSSATCLTVHRHQIPPTPTIIGPDTVCAGNIASYQLLTGSDTDMYSWKITGGQFTSNTDSAQVHVKWGLFSGTGEICGQVANACGASKEICQDVFLQLLDQPFAGPDTSVCGDQFQLLADGLTAGALGHWSLLSGPGSVVFSDSLNASSKLTVAQSGIYLLEWQVTEGHCSLADTMQIEFYPSPVAGPDSIVCIATNEFYQYSTTLTGGTAPYLVNGKPMADSLFLSDLIPSGKAFQFTFSDSNGCSIFRSDSFTCACTSLAGQMSMDTLKLCFGDLAVAQHLGGAILDGNDTALYILHTKAGGQVGQILEQNNTGIFDFKPGMFFDTIYYISLAVGNSLNGGIDLLDPCLNISTEQPVVFFKQPSVELGVDTIVCGDQLYVSANLTPGFWSAAAMAANQLVFSDSLSAQTLITVKSPGDYTIFRTTEMNGCIDTDTLRITFLEIPVVSNLIYACDSTNENYTVQFNITSGTPPYSIDNNLIPGDTYISGPIQNNSFYSFNISDFNKCKSAPISGTFVCTCSSVSGTMSSTVLSVCVGDSVLAVLPSNYVLDSNDTFSFVLHTNFGTELGQVIAQNTSGYFGYVPGVKPDSIYYISFVVGNNLNGLPDLSDPCLSVALGQPVVFKKTPTADAGISTEVCGFSGGLLGNSGIDSGKWSAVSGPGMAIFDDFEAPITTVTVSTPGSYLFRWTVSNGLCFNSDTVNVQFYETPVVDQLEEICVGLNTAYTLVFKVSGGLPPYVVDGIQGALNGAAFLSSILPNNTSYTFHVTDAHGCKSPQIEGMYSCACITHAGSMNNLPLEFCIDQPAVAQWNNDANLDTDDLVQFVLHDQPFSDIGTVLAINTQPVFDYAQNFQPGFTYYISAVAGNNLGSLVDLSDPCLSVSPGTPVRWSPLPEAFIAGDTSICAGQPTALRFNGSGNFPLNLVYESTIGLFDTIILNNNLELNLPIVPLTSTTYTLVRVIENGPAGCFQQLNDTVVIDVQEGVSAGMPVMHPKYCQGAAPLLNLADFVSMESSGGHWGVNGGIMLDSSIWNTSTGTLQAAALPAGNYIFQYQVSGQPLCPDDTTELQIVIDPLPVASAGPDVFLDCLTPEALLDGSGSSQGAEFSYQWLLNDLPLPSGDSLYFWADKSGQFVLEVESQAGCTAMDTAEVAFSGLAINDVWVQLSPIRCYGEKNGLLRIDSVIGGTPPVLFSLNGGSFNGAQIFNHLSPGNYELVAQDAAGCEWSGNFILDEPPEIKINLGPDVEAALGDSLYLWLESTASLSALDTVIWQPLLDSTAAGQLYQRFLPLHSGLITALVRDTNGCVVQDVLLLKVRRNRRVYLPNVFQPGSAQNGVFKVELGSDAELVKVLEIYDRWGELVFESRNFLPEDVAGIWDGSFRGSDLPTGVYTFYLAIQFRDGEEETFIGTLTLLR